MAIVSTSQIKDLLVYVLRVFTLRCRIKILRQPSSLFYVACWIYFISFLKVVNEEKF